MQSDASPLQEQSKSETPVLEQELATLHERVVAQSKLLEERASQISDLKEDRDRWRQQAFNLLTNLNSTPKKEIAIKSRWWWPGTKK